MEGCGFQGLDIHYDIIGCLYCHILYSHQGGEDCNHYNPAHCKKCRREAIRYMEQLENEKHTCPECAEKTLAFHLTGLWD